MFDHKSFEKFFYPKHEFLTHILHPSISYTSHLTYLKLKYCILSKKLNKKSLKDFKYTVDLSFFVRYRPVTIFDHTVPSRYRYRYHERYADRYRYRYHDRYRDFYEKR